MRCRRIWCLLTGIAACAVPGAAAADTYLQFESGTFLARGNLDSEVAVTWSPLTPLDGLGVYLRVSAATGTWRDRVLAFDMPKQHVGAAIGARFALGRTLGLIEVGAERQDEVVARRVVRRTGLHGRLRLVWSPFQDAFVSADVHASGARRTAGIWLASGVPVLWGLKLGPVAGLSFGEAGTALSAGVSLTNLRLFGHEFALSGGWRRDERGTSGAFGTLWTARRF